MNTDGNINLRMNPNINPEIQTLSDRDLHLKLKNLVSEERKATLEVLKHLQETEDRKLYCSLGYGSLFEYVVRELSYSESAAYRRIQAMRLLRAHPDAEKRVVSGGLTLTTLARIQSFVKQAGETLEGTRDLLNVCEGKSSRDVEREIVRRLPAELAGDHRESIQMRREGRVEIKILLEERTFEQLEQLKNLLAHKKSSMSYGDLISEIAELALRKLDPLHGRDRRGGDCGGGLGTVGVRHNATPAPDENSKDPQGSHSSNNNPHSRHIPNSLKANIWKRDDGRCTFISSETNRRCGSKYKLQLDHITPFAQGGPTREKNLRLLCAAHNRWRAERREIIEEHR